MSSSEKEHSVDILSDTVAMVAVRDALKNALGVKFSEEMVNKALMELGFHSDPGHDHQSTDTSFSSLSSSIELMDVKWAQIFKKLGLSMDEDEAREVITAARTSFMKRVRQEIKPTAPSFDSIPESASDLNKNTDSVLDLVADKDDDKELMKLIDDLNMTSDLPDPEQSEDVSHPLTADQDKHVNEE